MTNGDFVKGVKILAKYVKDDDHDAQVGHDRIYFGPEQGEVSDEDAVVLHQLGWRMDDDVQHWYCFV